MNLLGFSLLGYLLGSLPFAILISKAFGLADPRSFGSKNPGATNVLRSGNKTAAALTLLGDAAKGWFAMTLAGLLGANPLGIAFAGICAFLGHIFPLFLGFRGGKGVATAFGVLLGFSGWLGLICLGTWLGVAAVFRYSSLASLSAAAMAPVAAWPLLGGDMAAVIAFMCVLLFWRHRENIRKLLAGTETRIGKKQAAQ